MRHNTPLFDAQGQPTEPLLRLLERLGVQHDGTLKGIRDSTQAAWYQAGKLRAEIKDQMEVGQLRNDCLGPLAALGFLREAEAPETSYSYALVLGATVVAVRKRLAFLRDEWERGVRFREIVLLGSERALLPDKEGMDVLYNPQNAELPFPEDRAKTAETPPRNEIEMMVAVYKQPDFPWTSRGITATAIHATGKANTSDTVQVWLQEEQPEPGACLAVSSQPFVSFQQVVIGNELPEGFTVTGVGPLANPSLPLATFLDNVAKLIYELARAESV